jgi:hypothetical protein
LIDSGFGNPLREGVRVSSARSGRSRSGFNAMPLYFFRIQNGEYSGASDHGAEIADRDAAWKELTGVCSTIAGGISRKLKQDSEWQMELLDEAKKPVFRIRIVAESLDQAREAFATAPFTSRRG